MGKNGIRLLIVAVVAIISVFLWQQHRVDQARKKADQEKKAKDLAELKAGLRLSEVLTASFRKTAALRVATLSGNVLSKGECESGNFIPNLQSTVAPYRTEFLVDLRKVNRASYRWNATERVMFVDLPAVTVDPSSIDMSRARSTQSGIFVSRACGMAMQQQVAGRLRAAADEKAHRGEYLAQAREAARAEVANLTRIPLAAAGMENAKVRVRFASDPVPNDRQWDVSRSIEEVLHDSRFVR